MPGFNEPKSEIALQLGPGYLGFDHLTWYVGNAKQAASYYVTRMNFTHIGYKGPENGSPCISSYIVENGDTRLVFTAPVCAPSERDDIPEDDKALLCEIHEHLTKHGDGVKDIAFRVNASVEAIWDKAVERGARSIKNPISVGIGSPNKEKKYCGSIQMATIGAYGDTTHTFINREAYTGPFLPGYATIDERDPINDFLPAVDFIEIDHCVGNQPWDGVDKAVKLYAQSKLATRLLP